MLPEEIVINHLNELLEAPCFMEHPEASIPSMVIVERVGGSESEHIRDCRFAIQSYGNTMYKACQLNDMVKSAMDKITESDHVSDCRLVSDYNFTDTSTKSYRYQAIYDLVLF